MKTVLFACVHNAGRSQMAAAFFAHLADPKKARAVSAGTRPAEIVHPVVVAVMKEAGIDLGATKPSLLTAESAARADVLITMGCGETCPRIPGLRTLDWPIRDPKDRSPADVRSIRDDVQRHVERLIREEGWGRS
jgi:arsenate reductase